MRKLWVALIIILLVAVVAGVGVVGFLGARRFMMNRMENGRGIVAETIKGAGPRIAGVSGLRQHTSPESYDDMLNNAVTDNIITSAQKDLILQERTSIQESITNINNQQLTAVQRENAFQQLRDSVYEWSNTNNIPVRFLGPVGIKGMGMGMGMMGSKELSP